MARTRTSRTPKISPRFLLIAGLVVVIAAGAWLAFTARSTRADLIVAQQQASVLQQAITVGDKAAAANSLVVLQRSARSAHDSSDDLVWKLSSKVPLVGDDIGSVSVVAEVLDGMATEVLPPLVDISTQLDLKTFSPKNGKVDLKKLATLNQPIASANVSLAASRTRLDEIDLDGINGAIRGPVGDLQKKVRLASEATSITNEALGLIPTMLGGKNRTYLIVFQNNAESRSTGGIPGAYLLAKVDRGQIELSEQGSGGEIGRPGSKIRLTTEEKDLYTSRMTRFFLDTNFTPEFPRTSQIMKAMVKEELDVDVDGVISVDPVAMSYVLAGTGPVTVPDGTKVTADNAIEELLNKSYLRYAADFDAQDQFFEDTAAELFDVVIDGVGETGTTIRGLVRASKENRILIWSDDEVEQEQLETMPVSATLTDDSALRPSLGVYLNDSVGSKLQYYLTKTTKVTSQECERFGAQTVNAKVTLASSVPKNANRLPLSILGASQRKNPGVMRMNLRFYLPTGGTLESARLNKTKLLTTTRTHKGHPIASVPVVLKPGAKSTVHVTFRTGPGQMQKIAVRSTPGAQPGTLISVGPSSCKDAD